MRLNAKASTRLRKKWPENTARAYRAYADINDTYTRV